MPRALLLLLCALPAASQKTHEICAPCHSGQVAEFQTHPHFAKDLSCDACHGPSVNHRTSTGAAAPDRVAAPEEVPALCGGCHPGEGQAFAASKHAAALMRRARPRAPSCGTCHGVHEARAAATIERACGRCHLELSALHSGKMAARCLGCHARHTLAAAKP
ncbi:MAG: hypothetical protein FJW37_04490 [Acidobacteria bacterium]|nr:hypothetical protein [Acidobacteriota bacterium]